MLAAEDGYSHDMLLLVKLGPSEVQDCVCAAQLRGPSGARRPHVRQDTACRIITPVNLFQSASYARSVGLTRRSCTVKLRGKVGLLQIFVVAMA